MYMATGCKHKIDLNERITKKHRTEEDNEKIKVETQNENYRENDKDLVHKIEFSYIDSFWPTCEHETQVSEGGEADLDKLLVDCVKNPGHTQFIPVEEFSLNHLPIGHHDNDLYEFVKLLADMTVRVGVKMISPDRPEFWPDSKIAYPFNNMGGRNHLRTGTGKIWGLTKYRNGCRQNGDKPWWMTSTSCPCQKCQHSDTPSDVWWEIVVYTATHVVFDSVEASHTTFRLFYDGIGSSTVELDNVSVDYVSIKEDRCRLSCVTCDPTLGDKIYSLKIRFNDAWFKVHEKYKGTRDVDRLTFIVSHPHGCAKQVSVGQWKDRYQAGVKDNYKFTYSTCTCPGSSGATVYCVGYSWWWGLYPPMHSGTVGAGLNCSGIGWVG